MAGVNQTGGGYKRITASGNVSPRPAVIIGVLCSTTTAGTFQVYDDPATGTATPITGVVTPAAGSFTQIGAGASTGLNVVVGGTLDATVIYA